MPISDVHPEYAAMQKRWRRCRDVAAGTDEVKAAGVEYLPPADGMDAPGFAAYVMRAMFYGALSRTVDGLTGSIFQKAPVVKAPEEIVGHMSDINLANTTIELFAQTVVREVLTTGRYGVLVDRPGAEAPTNRPYWLGFPAEEIVSWRTEWRNGDEVLTRVILRERVMEADASDPYRLGWVDQYRELALVDGVYQVRLFVRLPPSHVRVGVDRWINSEPIIPTRRGKPLDFIPFVFIGARALSACVERPPLLDLADVVLSHYRNSAELEHLLYYVGLPMPWVAGIKGESNVLKYGPSIVWHLEQGGQAGILEMTGQGAGALREQMKEKQRLMASLGARLLEEAADRETATSVSMRHVGEHANLRTIAQVVEQGLTYALRWHSWWEGFKDTPAEAEALVELNKEIVRSTMSSQDLYSWVNALQQEAISFETFHEALRRGDVARPGVSAEDEKTAIDKRQSEIALRKARETAAGLEAGAESLKGSNMLGLAKAEKAIGDDDETVN